MCVRVYGSRCVGRGYYSHIQMQMQSNYCVNCQFALSVYIGIVMFCSNDIRDINAIWQRLLFSDD